MTLFELTFAIAVPFRGMDPDEEKTPVSPSTPKTSKRVKSELSDPMLINGYFRVDYPPQYGVHIEYELIPDVPHFSMDIITWGPVAKIYTYAGSEKVKTFIRDKVSWIVFSVFHHIEMSTEMLRKLHSHIVEFTILDGLSNISERARMDNPQAFEMTCPDLLSFQTHPKKVNFLKLTELILPRTESHYDNPAIYDSTTRLVNYRPTPSNCEPIESLINYYTRRPHLLQIPEPPIVKTHKVTQPPQPYKYNPKVTVECDALFTDVHDTQGDIRFAAPTVYFVAVNIRANNLMTDEQMVILNPNVVRIDRLLQLPSTYLKEQGFKFIFLKYKICDSPPRITHPRRLADTIRFDVTHSILATSVNKACFMEYMQTAKLNIQLYGIRDPVPKPRPLSFGEMYRDNYFGNIHADTLNRTWRVIHAGDVNEEPVLLAITRMDISTILSNNHLTHIYTGHFDMPINELQSTFAYANNRYNVDTSTDQRSPLTNNMLFETELKVVIRQVRNLMTIFMKTHASVQHFNRILVIPRDREAAGKIITKILQMNQYIMKYERLNPNYLDSEAKTDEDEIVSVEKSCTSLDSNESVKSGNSCTSSMEDAENAVLEDVMMPIIDNPIELDPTRRPSLIFSRQVLTGFVIDSFDKVIIFVEGESTGTIQELNLFLNYLDKSVHQTILFNSQLMFYKRMYADFTVHGGILSIILDEPIEKKLARTGSLMKGYNPEGSRQALRQLCQLIAAKTMADASKRCLFPSAQSLFCLSMEYGVPFYKTQPTPSLLDYVETDCVAQMIVQAYEHTAYEDTKDDPNDPDSGISVFRTKTLEDINCKSEFWGSETSISPVTSKSDTWSRNSVLSYDML